MTQVEPDVQMLDRVSSTVRKLVDENDAPIAEAMVRAIVRSLPRGDLAVSDAETLGAGCVQFWRFGNERKESHSLVRVYTPSESDHDWHCEHTVIEIINDDMPFLVDSVVSALGRFGAGVQLLMHPILTVSRDANGRLTGVGESEGAIVESWIHLRIDPQVEAMHLEIEEDLKKVTADVRVVVEDWQAIRAKTHAIVAELESNPPPLPPEEIDEGVRFLNWMDDHHFTFLGYRLCDFKGEGQETVARIEPGLGLLRDPEYTVFDGMRNLGAVPAEVRHFVEEPSLLRITKANRRSRVHRPVHLDTIAVKRFNKKGEVIGDHLFLGLFTAAAYSRSPRYIPLLRQRVGRTLERAGFARASHNGKALQHILETYPRDELFQIGEDDLFEISMGILGLQERQKIAFYVRRDPFERFVSCLVFVPRDRYDTRMRIQAQKILEDAYNGKVDAFYTHMTDEALARLHIIVRTKRGEIPDIPREEVERRIAEAGRLWSDRVREQLLETHGPEEALRLARRYRRASAAYEEQYDSKTAVHDIDHMERAFASPDGLSLHLHRDPDDADDAVRVKVFLRGSPVPLSDVLPKLENMGMRVIEEYPYRVRLDTGEHGSIHDFVTRLQGRTMKLDRVRDVFHEAFRAIWNGETENDGFNRLVLGVGLSGRDITVLRAYCKYLLQARIPFSQAYMERTLANNQEIARILIEFFRCRFDPGRPGVGLD
ncbi:MAG: NAD-glutamate dehydrogenase, partial [Planctomycetota bacterium]